MSYPTYGESARPPVDTSTAQPADPRLLPVVDRGDARIPLVELINKRPPWAWSNLSPEQADQLDRALGLFVTQHNEQLAATVAQIIPPCWRQHPPLVHELPVIYWGWWAAARDPRAAVLTALEFFGRHLPGFHTRLPELLGPGAQSCRKGRHVSDDELAETIRLGMSTKQPQPPLDPSVWITATFGA